ncbi:MAG: bifunctional UDP-N-acetylmuramoyl-tripeptide:D-alanyl-D-alanine ligase/alanine racemase [Flavobacteriales bacterium]|nr:bifunctional UDP-N-acetylmuramoyl-tripeptide:D-alanyl-D-alanine ligase/alanine racemase [Flavobacteriales bacterium]
MSNGQRLSGIARALGAEFTAGPFDPVIEHLAIDSRKAIATESTLFIALSGQRHDGHAYIAELAKAGVKNFLVNVSAPIPKIGGITVLKVPDTLSALQMIGAWHRSHFQIPVIGITGSNGKTIVKEWLYQLLSDEDHIVRSPGSWNSQVGVPLSVWEMNAGHTLGIFEAGISRLGEMERLAPIIAPTIGVFTNVGPAHSSGFNNDTEKAAEKARLFAGAKEVIHCAEHEVVTKALLKLGVPLVSWSRKQEAFLQVLSEEVEEVSTRLTLKHGGHSFDVVLPFIDHASVENALLCITVMLHLGRSPRRVTERISQLRPVAMRLETVDGVHGSTILNDAYSNDLASLGIAMEHLQRIGKGRKKAVVLSDMADNKEAPAQLAGRINAAMRKAQVDLLVAVGPQLGMEHAALPKNTLYFTDTEALLAALPLQQLEHAAVLVKGARTFAFERVVERLQEKVHGTVLEVDLDAVRHNLNYFRSLIPGPSPVEKGEQPMRKRIMCMVKADGYGAGAVELARLFAHEQVHYLGVAYADEGIVLRQAGIHLPIMVMNPEPVPHEVMHRFRLETEVYNMRSLRDAIAHATDRSDAPPVHIKLDTGMHRLGFQESDLDELCAALKNAPALKVASILSHLAASEDPAHDAFTREQIAMFERMSERIIGILGYRPLLHMANSGAVGRFPEAHFDMVRLGIGLHGVGVHVEETARLLPTAALRSPIAQIKHIAKGESVSYGRRFVAQHDMRIAILPLGYADGLDRKLGHGVGRLWINGKSAPFVGTICMDMCMVDVTATTCQEGDMGFLFNAMHPVTEVAADLGTISYEVLTSISPRVKRVYVLG